MSEVFRENSIDEIVVRYKSDVDKLYRYVPWFESHVRESVQDTYSNENMEHTIPFPVYDSTLLSFVKEFQRTGLVDRNYAYVYSRNRLHNSADELKLIENAEIKNLEDICGILSKYVIEGNVRGSAWSEGVSNGVYRAALIKMKEVLDFWSKEPKGRV